MKITRPITPGIAFPSLLFYFHCREYAWDSWSALFLWIGAVKIRTAGVRMDKPAWDVSAESCQSIGVHAHFAREDIGRDQQIEQADAFRLAHGSSAIQDRSEESRVGKEGVSTCR